MPNRLAGSCSLVVFAFCLILGIQAGNSFSTTLSRALIAMAGTFGVGLAVGWVAQKMLDENMQNEEQKAKKEAQGAGNDR